MPVRVGVVGVGYLGRHHARIYSGLEGVELSAVVDTDAEKAGEMAEKYGSRAYADYRKMLGEVQAVSVVTPTASHRDIAMDFLRAGSDVLIEKPITSTLAEADSLIEEASKRGAILQVGHLERYNPAVVAASKLIDRPRFFESERMSPFLERAANVDVTLDLMIHDIDIVMSLLGTEGIETVRAVGAKVLSDNVDVAKAWIEFKEGVAALITAARVSNGKQRRLKIFQKDSYVVLDYQERKLTKYSLAPGGISAESITVEDREPLKEELVDFVDCVVARRRPRASGVEGRNALEVALSITEMIRKSADI
jgi:predicted dehydrogenase